MNSADLDARLWPRARSFRCEQPVRRQGRTFIFCVLATLTASCAIVDPIRPAAYNTYFSHGLAASAAAKAAASAGGESTRDVRPFALGPATANTTCIQDDLGPTCFAGGLGVAIDVVDERRIELVHLAKQVSNGNATYNALLYPLGGALVYAALRGSSDRNLLLPTVIAASAYGYANSGVVDRERHYLRTAGELHCAIVQYGSWLYPTDHIFGTGEPHLFAPLDVVVSRLERATLEFEQKRVELSTRLKPRQGVAAPAQNVFQQRVAEATGRGRGGTSGSDARSQIDTRTWLQLNHAQQVLGEVKDLRWDIHRSGSRLRSDWTDIELMSQRLLSERVPLPAPPDQATRAIQASTPLLRAQGERASEVPTDNELDPAFPISLRDGVSTNAQVALNEFASGPAVVLSIARAQAQLWLDEHAQRQARVATNAQRLGCGNRLPPIQQRSVDAQGANARRPNTNVTPSGNGGNGGNANQGRSSALPPARTP